MSGFNNIREYVEAMTSGRLITSTFRKIPGQASTAYCWSDLVMAPGQPLPNYYATNPLDAAILNSSPRALTTTKFKGIYNGDNISPRTKFLSKIMLTTGTANMVGRYLLMDYLLYYPFVDTDSTDLQPMGNRLNDSGAVVDPTLPDIPRYTDGVGVQAIMICAAPTLGGGSFTFTYIDDAGTLQTSPTNYYGTSAAYIAQILNQQSATAAGVGPYLKLASGSKGVRRITSITNDVGSGGLGTLVLVKPLADCVLAEAFTTMEICYMADTPRIVQILDGAFLGFICFTIGSITGGLLQGQLEFVWTA